MPSSTIDHPPTRLHAIVDVEASTRTGVHALDAARAFLDGGATLIQLRAKQLASGPFLELADACVRLAAPYQAAIVINDRVDIARLAGASGVHVGQDDLPPSAARRLLGERRIVGVSTHTLEQLDAALRQPISYVAVGPVFGTTTKDTGYRAVGLEMVAAAAQRAGALPVVAIGGITLENARSVIDAGAAAVAVISDLIAGGAPEQRTRAFLQRLADPPARSASASQG